LEQKLQLEIPLLLPNIADESDQCVERLKERLAGYRGIEKAHVDRKDGQTLLCLHYDPNLVSLEWVGRLAEEAGAEVTKRYLHETLRITGMDCADCALSVEHLLSRLPGVITVSVGYAAEKMRIEYDAHLLTHNDILARVRWMGYEIEEEEEEGGLREHWKLVLALTTGFFLTAGFFGERFLGLHPYAATALYLLAYFSGGYDATRHGIKAALHLRFDVDFLMVVAALGAAALGEWAEGALLLFLFSLGHSLEHYATGRARHAIRALGELTPKTARVRRDGREIELPVEDLQRGDVVIVRPGERIPTDGRMIEGRSAVDQSPVTGESMPVDKEEGDAVFAGTVNGEGALEIAVTKLAQDTTLARVVQMVEEAQSQKTPSQRFIEKFERIFVPAVMGVVVLVLVVPPLVGWLSWSVAFLRAMAILVAASPCALALAVPSAVLSGVAHAARNGVLIKGGVHLEHLGGVKAVAFDKTGTLTKGEPEVTDVIPLNGMDERALLRIAAAVESRSGHPLAQAILRKAGEQDLELPEVGEFQSSPGRGVQAELDGQIVRIGNLKLFDEEGPMPGEVASRVEALETDGKTTMVVEADGRFLGFVGLADRGHRYGGRGNGRGLRDRRRGPYGR